MEWLQTEASPECEHYPNDRGTACEHCGIPAEMVTPDELVLAMAHAYSEAHARAEGQTSWLDR